MHSNWNKRYEYFSHIIITTGHLTIADLEQVIDKVWDARVKWYQIGLGIKIKSTDLDAIRKRHGNDPDECFCELLSVWLNQASPKPTWALLTKALKSRLVGFEQLSEKLGSQSQIIECGGKSQQHESEIVNPKSDKEVYKCLCSKCDILDTLNYCSIYDDNNYNSSERILCLL